jgi:hypothetical protein
VLLFDELSPEVALFDELVPDVPEPDVPAPDVCAPPEVVLELVEASGVLAQSATLVAPAAITLAALTATVTRAARLLPDSRRFIVPASSATYSMRP